MGEQKREEVCFAGVAVLVRGMRTFQASGWGDTVVCPFIVFWLFVRRIVARRVRWGSEL